MSFRSFLHIHSAKMAAALVASSALILSGCSDDDDDPTPKSSVRVVHAVPDAPPVNVKLSGGTAVPGLDYAASSGFAAVNSGTYDITVEAIVPGADPEVINVPDVSLATGARTTIFAVGTVDATDGADRDIAELVVTESAAEPDAGQVSVVVLHAAPAANDVDIYVTAPGAALMLGDQIDADFKQSVDAGALATGSNYQIRITADGDPTTVVYDSGSVDLSPFAGQKLIIAAINTTNAIEQASAPVKLLAVNDSTQLELLDLDTEAGAKVVHLSPDAGEVEVFANTTTELIPAFDYTDIVADAATYANVASGDYVFDVAPNTDSVADSVYTSGTLNLAAGSETSVLALGYVATTPAFELFTSADDNRAYATHAKVKIIHGAAAVGNVNVYVTADGATNASEVAAGNGGLPVLINIPFKADSGYIDLGAGTYDIYVQELVGDTVVIEVQDVPIAAGDVLTVIARGPDENAPINEAGTGVVVLTN